MTNFYPGPSKIHPEVEQWMQRAYASGILERNHRSKPFMVLLEETIANFKTSQKIPEDYEVYFTSSATECWEILNQSVLNGDVRFLYNGAFGKKWFKYAVSNHTPFIESLRGSRFHYNEIPHLDESSYDCLCLVHTETSNGTSIPDSFFNKLNPDALQLVDATSSMGGVKLPWEKADAWFCSTQKALGLPSGMGILVVSPRLIEKAKELDERNHYNSLLTIMENFKKYQTHYTPNILLIYLLNEVSKKYRKDKNLAQSTENQYNILESIILESKYFSFLTSDKSLRSKTVSTLKSDKNIINKVLQEAEKKSLILGRGYGEWRENTFRIAHFPAHTTQDFKTLKAFFDELQF